MQIVKVAHVFLWGKPFSLLASGVVISYRSSIGFLGSFVVDVLNLEKSRRWCWLRRPWDIFLSFSNVSLFCDFFFVNGGKRKVIGVRFRNYNIGVWSGVPSKQSWHFVLVISINCLLWSCLSNKASPSSLLLAKELRVLCSRNWAPRAYKYAQFIFVLLYLYYIVSISTCK